MLAFLILFGGRKFTGRIKWRMKVVSFMVLLDRSLIDLDAA